MNQIEDTKERSMPSLAGSLLFRKLPEGTIGKWKCTIVLLRNMVSHWFRKNNRFYKKL